MIAAKETSIRWHKILLVRYSVKMLGTLYGMVGMINDDAIELGESRKFVVLSCGITLPESALAIAIDYSYILGISGDPEYTEDSDIIRAVSISHMVIHCS